MATTKVMRRFVKGIVLSGATDASIASDALEGSLFNSSATLRLKAYIQGAIREFVTTDQTQTLSGKTLTDPTINASGGSLTLPASAAPAQTGLGVVVYDTALKLTTVGNGAARDTLVDQTTSQIIANKAIRTPSRSDVKRDTTANLVTFAATMTAGDNGQFCFATDTKIMYQIVDGLIVSPASGGSITSQQPTGTIDGVNLVFTISFTPLQIIRFEQDGRPLRVTSDYSISGITLTLVVAPAIGQELDITYTT